MIGLRQLRALAAAALLCSPPLSVGCHEPEAPEQTRVLVEVGAPRVQDVDVTLRYPVELQADETVAITPVAISGFLRRVLVDTGDKVKAGQLIALVDCREYKAQRTSAETVIAKRVAQVEESRSQLERLERMGESLVAPAEIDRAAAEARVAEAELADAKAKLSEAGQRQGYCSLTAPFSGFVTERFLDPGSMVSPGGRPVVNIVKTRDVRVVASVIEADAPKVSRGVDVQVVLNAFPDTAFQAQVARTGRSLDPATRTLRVEMDIPNRTELLLPGMTGRASIVIDRRESALLVPITAVLQLEETAYIYVVKEQDGVPRAHRVEVELGVDQGDWVEVRAGLEPTDQVIMVGRELVGEGTEVQVAEAPEDAAPPPADELSVATGGPGVEGLEPTESAGASPKGHKKRRKKGEGKKGEGKKASAGSGGPDSGDGDTGEGDGDSGDTDPKRAGANKAGDRKAGANKGDAKKVPPGAMPPATPTPGPPPPEPPSGQGSAPP